MSTRSVLTPPVQALPDSPPPKKSLGHPKQTSTPIHELILLSPADPHAATPSIHLQSATNRGRDTVSSVPQWGEAEDEFTLTAYGDISLSEIIVPPLPSPTQLSPVQSKFPQLRLRLRRPPMPKRRPSYVYVPDPLPLTGGLDPEDRWPGSPRPSPTVRAPLSHRSFARSRSPIQRPSWRPPQSLASPLPVIELTTPRKQGSRPAARDESGSSIEKLFDELIPRSPSIRLSPPGSPVTQAHVLPRESDVRRGRNAPKANDVAKPAPKQEKPWRMRLPPRPPLPKWDVVDN